MRGLLVLALVAAVRGAEGAGECGATPPDKMALKLAPCASAAEDPSSAPSSPCCSAVHSIGKQSPKCLCAVMLSNTGKSAGIKAEVAITITIPKRCNLVDRPVGYKCGGNQAITKGLLSTLVSYSCCCWSSFFSLHFLLRSFILVGIISRMH
ncbi:non-specific lipid transfer protein GPI-anchored 15-like [Miscanthus floridulus]|uniref:non-specific lipid transfer protein GPI-anchored 15-like n=1 Tax=Miscanthus floridulus TaxID=154761 RepID=UPI00345859EF